VLVLVLLLADVFVVLSICLVPPVLTKQPKDIEARQAALTFRNTHRVLTQFPVLGPRPVREKPFSFMRFLDQGVGVSALGRAQAALTGLAILN